VRVGTGAWGREHGNGSVGMGVWSESMGTTAWGRERITVILLSDYSEWFFDQLISFLTLAWKNEDDFYSPFIGFFSSFTKKEHVNS